MSKKLTERSRGSPGVKNVPKERKVPKTGAERIRAYRQRQKALDRAYKAAAERALYFEPSESSSEQNSDDNQVENKLSGALKPQSSQGDQKAGENDRTKNKPRAPPAKTPAERARAYRARRRALKIATMEQEINAGRSSPYASGSLNSGVESSAAASGHYKPTLWYYKHLNFLSGNNDPVSGDSDSEHNEDTVYVQGPRAKKRPAARATSVSHPAESEPSVDASAAAFGRSVGAQLHHLSKMQRCIAEKLISDVIYHAKMEQLSMDTIIDVKEPADTTVNLVSPEAATSWYGTETAFERQRDLDQASSSHTVDTIEDRLKREIEETESAVNFIKMESDDTENYCFQDVEEQNNAIDIIKEELM